MKKVYTILSCITLSMFLLTLTSCEKDLEVYSSQVARLNFYYGLNSPSAYKPELSQSTFSFVYTSDDCKQDTVWFEVESMGIVRDFDRPISIKQTILAGEDNAEAGKHYVAFNDPKLAHLYVMPAKKARVKIPVVLLRDASLKAKTVVLQFEIADNGVFTNGYDNYQKRTLTFTDRLSEPAEWSTSNYTLPEILPDYYITFGTYMGDYGVRKHLFLIEKTGKKWDDEDIKEFMASDINYRSYMRSKMSRLLAKENEERAAKGLEPLMEDDGTPVVIEDV